jgi:hypothetical protein
VHAAQRIVTIQTSLALQIEDGGELFKGFEGELLQSCVDQRVMIGKGEVVYFDGRCELIEMLFREDAVGFEERLSKGNSSQSETAVMLQSLYQETKINVVAVYHAFKGGLGLSDNLTPKAFAFRSDSNHSV